MTLFKKCQTFFHQTSMRFHSAIATLEPQKYVITSTVGTENILLVSGRLVRCNDGIVHWSIDSFVSHTSKGYLCFIRKKSWNW